MKSTKYLLFVFLCGLFGSCNNDHDIENLKTEAGKYQLSNVEAKAVLESFISSDFTTRSGEIFL